MTSRWGMKPQRLEAVPSMASGWGIPTAHCAFGDDLLDEIDGLLDEQDVLFGFWQAPGQ